MFENRTHLISTPCSQYKIGPAQFWHISTIWPHQSVSPYNVLNIASANKLSPQMVAIQTFLKSLKDVFLNYYRFGTN